MASAPPISSPLLESIAAPDAAPAAPKARPIDRLKPGNERTTKVKDRLVERIRFSERAMSELYPRWNNNELALQAYIRLPNKQKAMSDLMKTGNPAQQLDIVVPYAYASQEALVGYLSAALFGRRPIFQVEAVSGTLAEAAQNAEYALQYNADRANLYRGGMQFLWDTATYGLGAFQVPYVEEYSRRTRIRTVNGTTVRSKEQVICYSGSLPETVDPYNFFPDPRVPLARVAIEGDFVFWRTIKSSLWLREMESAGIFSYAKDFKGKLPDALMSEELVGSSRSERSKRVGVPNTMRSQLTGHASIEEWVQVDQGVVKIIPSEWGLGESNTVERWLFTLLNHERLVQAEPFDADHDQHPVVACEPWSFGYEFGSLAATDFTLPFQEILSWLINSRMHNVRATVNNQFIVDPSRIEMQDVEKSGPGKVIRLKKAFYGSDIRMAITQFPITDVTQGHLQDIQVIQRIADQVLGVNDNLRGQVNTGGRKSATEARIAMEAGAGRLQTIARLISAEALSQLGTQMIVNLQQYMPDEMAISILGADGHTKALMLRPEMISGDFNFRVADGTLPVDKQAQLETWKELLLAIMQDPELRQMYSVGQVFEYIGELSGARNLGRFRQQQPAPVSMNIETMPDEQVALEAAAGNLLPIPGVSYA